MPPRLNKRQQREQEELLKLSVDYDESADEEAVPVKPVALGFAAVRDIITPHYTHYLLFDSLPA